MKYLLSLWAGIRTAVVALLLIIVTVTILAAARVGPFARPGLVGISGPELLVLLVGVIVVFVVSYRRTLRRLSRSDERPRDI